ncbi:3745_t:CDS:2 [Funneliformis geosporum]|uniref:819_t:CDS:1 n=1 Tax=Funneliformis geosporum TaxID=1117311 RepID=A0A9W4SDB0_9GLOM|nr:3745_t:CDS:2 [Funneliformis geosporum]CAI2165478.1 819_t:CDS:2 [Funneliformis geosporum]
MENSNLQNNPPQNPFYKYSLKQRKESEEFGRLTIDYIKRQNENLQQLFSESEIVESRIKDYCRCKEKIIEQEHLIGSLKYRIEQLEASIVIKNQDINNYLNIIRKSKEEMELKENRETLDTKQKCHKADSELSRKDHMTSKISSISSNDNENKQTKQVQDPPIYTITIGEIIKKYAGKVQESQKQKQGNIMISDSLLDIPSTNSENDVELKIKVRCACEEKFRKQEILIDSLKSQILRLEDYIDYIFSRNQEIDDVIKTINEQIKRLVTTNKLEDNGESSNNADYKSLNDLNVKQEAKYNYNNSISPKDQDPPIFTITMSDVIKRYTAKVKETRQKKYIVPEPPSNETSLKSSVTQNGGVIENLKRLKSSKKDEKAELQHTNDAKAEELQVRKQAKKETKSKLKQRDAENKEFENNLKSSKKSHGESADEQDSASKQIHKKLQQIITKENLSSIVRFKQLLSLNDSFTHNELIRYTKTNDFNSLNDRTKRLINILIQDILSTSTTSQTNENDATRFEKLHKQIITIAENRGRTIRIEDLNFLKDPSVFNILIHYSESHNFDSLSNQIKSFINLIIYNNLKEEFNQQKVKLSQNLEEYIKRGLIPQLPTGYHRYSDYEKTIMFLSLSKKQKSRVRKLIALEK